VSDESAKRFLVVIGSSAGGVEALSILLAGLARDFPAAIVIAQHLDPLRTSNLAGVLERRSALPLVLVEDTVKLEPAKVFVVPANRHVMIRDGHVSAEGDHRDRPRPSVDLLLATAAEAYGEQLIAVILTGAGSDGASGALEVKRHGGTVVIQNPATARFPAMPLALPPTAVDHVADLEKLPSVLDALVRGAEFPEEATVADGAREILSLVSQTAGVDFGSYKQSTILRRIARRMVVTHTPSIEEYRRHLEQHRDEVQRLATAFLIKVTEFFRDAEAFEFIREGVLPVLIERARLRGRVLRLWSAGCATGEEPYSLAIMVAELLGTELPDWNVKIFATDLDEASITYARHGLYPEKALAKMPEDLRARYFEPSDAGMQVAKVLRQMVIFGQQDISRGVPFPRIDLVVCRNLLIYFKPELQQHVLELFAYSLSHAGGFLFLGKSETARPSNAAFELVEKRWKVYRCTKPPVLLATRRGGAGPLHFMPEPARAARKERTTPEGTALEVEPGIKRFEEVLVRNLPVGIAVVDRAYRLLTINTVARRLLGIRELGHEQDFLHAVRGLPYGQLRDAIDAVFRDHSTITLAELEVDRVGIQGVRNLTVTVTHAQGEPVSEFAIVSVADATEAVVARRNLESVQQEQGRLLAELTTANKRLSDMNKDLQDANEELQATNEEMTLAQEELQASNEELEATNEELQATNEELETNNEELQATNEELEATNEELSARTQELQELARTLGNERIRLTEVLEHAPMHLLVLRGPTLLVEHCNPRFGELLAGREWTARPVEEVLRGFESEALVDAVRAAFWNDRTSQEVPAVFEALHLRCTVAPFHDATGRVEGVLVFGRS
jgi:two-component system CheB/CheR fusion protein